MVDIKTTKKATTPNIVKPKLRRKKSGNKTQQRACWLNLSLAAVLVLVSFLLSTMAWTAANHKKNKNNNNEAEADLTNRRTTKRDTPEGNDHQHRRMTTETTTDTTADTTTTTPKRRTPKEVEVDKDGKRIEAGPPPRFTTQKETDGEDDDEVDAAVISSVWSLATEPKHHHDSEDDEDEDYEHDEDEEEFDDDDDDDDDEDGPSTGYGKDMPPIQETLVSKVDKSKIPYNPLKEDPVDKCRRDPTWRRTADYQECQRLTKWEPRDTWWRLDQTRNDVVLEGHFEDIRKCIDKRIDAAYKHQKFPWTLCNEQARNASCQVLPTEVTGYYKSAKEGEAVLFENAMTEQEVFGLQALQGCMHKYLPQDDPWWDYREFGEDNFDKEKVMGGNEVTYVQGMIQLYLPGIAATLYRNFRMAYKHGNWAQQGFMDLGYPPPNSLGIRTAECLEYRDSGRLGTHADSESIFTIAVALSEEESYQGGHFRFNSEHALFKVPRLGAVSFFSESFHGVTKVTGGDRSIFVVEIWESDDAPPGVPRCDPQVWFEHMQDRWPVVTGAEKEYLTEEMVEDGKKKRKEQGDGKYGGKVVEKE